MFYDFYHISHVHIMTECKTNKPHLNKGKIPELQFSNIKEYYICNVLPLFGECLNSLTAKNCSDKRNEKYLKLRQKQVSYLFSCGKERTNSKKPKLLFSIH